MTEEQKQQFIKEASAAIFYGKSVGEMSRDELLVLIGFLGRQQKQDREQLNKMLTFI